MARKHTVHKHGDRHQEQDPTEWIDAEAQKKRLAQKSSYTTENKQLIERLIHHVQKI